jgi:hypothetical protein
MPILAENSTKFSTEGSNPQRWLEDAAEVQDPGILEALEIGLQALRDQVNITGLVQRAREINTIQ